MTRLRYLRKQCLNFLKNNDKKMKQPTKTLLLFSWLLSKLEALEADRLLFLQNMELSKRSCAFTYLSFATIQALLLGNRCGCL